LKRKRKVYAMRALRSPGWRDEIQTVRADAEDSKVRLLERGEKQAEDTRRSAEKRAADQPPGR